MDMLSIQKAAVFRGLDETEVHEAIPFLHAEEKSFRKGQMIFHAGKKTSSMGLVLEGSVTIESNDLWGNRTILSHVAPGQFFAETYALLRTGPMLVDIRTNEKSRILFLNVGNLNNTSMSSSWQAKIIRNLLMISAQKNLVLSGRSFHTASKSIRGRVMSYLNTVALQKKSASFDIPFDRQQLADYLSVERSALSKELGRMQRDGILTTRKKHFEILKQSET